MFVTNCHGNLMRELDGKVPREVLSELYDRLNERDQTLLSRALFVGLAMPGERPRIQAGEFLIRNVLGMDPQSGAIWVGAELEANSIVQFHVRDALSSSQDLERALLGYETRHTGSLRRPCSFPASAAARVSTAAAITTAMRSSGASASFPIGGFFCSGEIGAVHGHDAGARLHERDRDHQ